MGRKKIAVLVAQTEDKMCTPELSSVDNSVEAACVAAVSMLIHKLKNHRIPSELTVSSAVVYRKTTR